MRKGRGQIAAEAAMVLAALFTALMLFGCASYKGAKVTEGVDFSAGIDLPASEGAAQLSFVNYLSGFRFGVAENSGMECEFASSNRFSFAFGLWESEEGKHFRAKEDPCETAPTAREPETAADEPPPDAPKIGCGKPGCKCLNCNCAPTSCPCTDMGGIGICGCLAPRGEEAK